MCSCGKQWGKTISLLPTLTPSQRLRNCLLTMKFLAQHALYDNNIHTKFQGQNIYTKKNYLQSTNMCSCEILFIKDIEIVEVCQIIMLLN